MVHVLYTVWVEGSGDIYKGYNNKVISSHLDKSVANTVADLNSGWVEGRYENLHEDYIARLQEDDKNLKDNQRRIMSSARDMLNYGG